MSSLGPDLEARFRQLAGEYFASAHAPARAIAWDDFRPGAPRPIGEQAVWVGLDALGMVVDLVVAAPRTERFGSVRVLERRTCPPPRVDEALANLSIRYRLAGIVAPPGLDLGPVFRAWRLSERNLRSGLVAGVEDGAEARAVWGASGLVEAFYGA